MKKILTMLFVILTLSYANTYANDYQLKRENLVNQNQISDLSAQTIQYGDFDNNGQVDRQDYTLMKQLLLGLTSQAAINIDVITDFDGDQRTTSKDLALMYKRVNNKISLFPVENYFYEANSFYDSTISSFYAGADPKTAILPAIEKYKQFINENPGSCYIDDAQLIIGRMYHWTQDPEQSRIELQKVIDTSSSFDRIDKRTMSHLDLNFYSVEGVDEATTKISTSAYAKLFIAYIYNDKNYFPNSVDFNRSNQELRELISNYPVTSMTCHAQYELGINYEWMQQSRNAVDEFKKVICNYPNEKQYIGFAFYKIGYHLNLLNDTAEIDKFAAELAQAYSSQDYYAECGFESSNGLPQKWESTNFSVEIDASTVTSDQKALIINALNEWSTKTNNKMTFDFVENQGVKMQRNTTGAGIFIRVGTLYGPEGQCVGRGDERGLYSAEITISSAVVDNKFFEFVALHEIGHAFGLSHSFNRADVMTFGNGYTGDNHLSNRDVNTILRMYP